MSRILVFRLIGLFAPQAKSGESLITEERDDRYSAAIHRPLEFLINKVIGKLDITSILTGVTIEDAANTSPINGTQTHRTGLTRSVDSTSRKVKCAKTTTSLTLLLLPATISPSFTMTDPNGPPPRLTLSLASRIASRINCLSCSVIIIV